MKVPLLDLVAQYETIRPELDEAVRRVVSQQRFILGPEVSALEQEVAAYCEGSHAVGCASGSDAILLALMALGIGPGDEVICPSYTFFATAGSIFRLGARPVFADIEPVTYNLDPESVRRVARGCKHLKAIMPVHLYGQVADMDAIEPIARELGVPVIEDAAQAIGARDAQGLRVGSRENMVCFSFFPSKNLGAFGDAGMVVTRDRGLAERIEALRMHGSTVKYYHPIVGLNSRIDALQAAVLRVKLPHLDGWTKARQENASTYDQRFAALGAGTTGMSGEGSDLPLRTPRPAASPATHIYNQYVIRVPAGRRDPLREHLTERGIGSEIYYPLPLHRQECFAELGCQEGSLPESEAAARETLALPVFPELTREQLEWVVTTVGDFLKAG